MLTPWPISSRQKSNTDEVIWKWAQKGTVKREEKRMEMGLEASIPHELYPYPHRKNNIPAFRAAVRTCSSPHINSNRRRIPPIPPNCKNHLGCSLLEQQLGCTLLQKTIHMQPSILFFFFWISLKRRLRHTAQTFAYIVVFY